jgi:hypothetical protein
VAAVHRCPSPTLVTGTHTPHDARPGAEQAPTGAPSVGDGLPFPTTTVVTWMTRFARSIPALISREYWLAASSS